MALDRSRFTTSCHAPTGSSSAVRSEAEISLLLKHLKSVGILVTRVQARDFRRNVTLAFREGRLLYDCDVKVDS